MKQITAKNVAKEVIDHLPDEATLNDIMYELYVCQKIEKGLRSVQEGHIISHEEVKRRLLNREN